MTASLSPRPVTAGLADLVARQRAQVAAWNRKRQLGSLRRKLSRSHPAAGSPLAEQRRLFLDLDPDATCHPRGFACPACPPTDNATEVTANA